MIDIDWQVGQKVRHKKKYQYAKPYDAIGHIEKTTPSRYIIRFAGYGVWSISRAIMYMIEKI